ncbi:MAG: ABC transporter permease [Bacteroidaceae bacterium]|nr:ABC transporter permease [Bacteroidaceae bacterium]MBR1520386.1 ABC transporter permease [Bacteroidaceae bacterium]
MFDYIIEIIGSLRRNRLRTLATGFAVASGLFLLIVLQGAGNGIIHTFEQNSEDFSFDAITIYPGSTSMPFEGMKEGRSIQLDEDDQKVSEKAFPNEVEHAVAQVSQSGASASVGENYLSSVTLEGVYPETQDLEAVKMLEGRFINKIDLAEQRKVIVISNKNRKDLFKHGEHALNQHVRVGSVSYMVVGVYKDDEMENNSTFYAPFTTIRTIYGKGKFVDELHLKSKNLTTEEANERFEENYRKAMAGKHSYDPADKSALWIWNNASQNADMNKASNILHTALWVLGLLTLLSGVTGVSNIMLISVKERTHEFGIRKAIGAKPHNIIGMVVMESIVITTIFGYIGMLLGIFFCEYMDATVGSQTMDMGVFQQKYFVDPTVDISTCITATIVIIIAGALAGFFPARKAAKVKPIEALRG